MMLVAEQYAIFWIVTECGAVLVDYMMRLKAAC
jgi:hypothetical protein